VLSTSTVLNWEAILKELGDGSLRVEGAFPELVAPAIVPSFTLPMVSFSFKQQQSFASARFSPQNVGPFKR
jgi:hypothetical protein